MGGFGRPIRKISLMRESGFFKGSFGGRKLAHNRPTSQKQMELPPIGVGINYGTITGRGAGGARFFGEGVVNLGSGGSSTSSYCPFTIQVTTQAGSIGGSGGVDVSLSLGTVNGIMPGNNMSTIPKPSGTAYVVIRCNSDGKSVVSAQWAILTSPPTAPVATIDVAPTTFEVLVGTITGSPALVSRVIPCTNIVARVAPSIQTDRTSYIAGQRNYNQFYTWVF